MRRYLICLIRICADFVGSIYFAVVCACGDGGYVADDAGYAQPGFGFEGGGL